MSSYRTAIDRTIETIEKRTKYFRNLVVTVTLVCLGSCIWAAIAWNWLPLFGVLLLLPICGLYLFMDAKLLNHWRHEHLIKWVKMEIDFRAFYEAVTAITTLPMDTVQSMLDTLPIEDDLVREQSFSSDTREAVGTIMTAIHTCQSDLLAFKAAGFAIAGCALIVAAVYWMWQPLLWILAVCLIFPVQKWAKTKRLKLVKTKITKFAQDSNFDVPKFLEIIAKIQWDPVSVSERKTVLEALQTTG